MSKDMDFCNLQEIYPGNLGKIFDATTKPELDPAKTVFHKISCSTRRVYKKKKSLNEL